MDPQLLDILVLDHEFNNWLYAQLHSEESSKYIRLIQTKAEPTKEEEAEATAFMMQHADLIGEFNTERMVIHARLTGEQRFHPMHLRFMYSNIKARAAAEEKASSWKKSVKSLMSKSVQLFGPIPLMVACLFLVIFPSLAFIKLGLFLFASTNPILAILGLIAAREIIIRTDILERSVNLLKMAFFDIAVSHISEFALSLRPYMDTDLTEAELANKSATYAFFATYLFKPISRVLPSLATHLVIIAGTVVASVALALTAAFGWTAISLPLAAICTLSCMALNYVAYFQTYAAIRGETEDPLAKMRQAESKVKFAEKLYNTLSWGQDLTALKATVGTENLPIFKQICGQTRAELQKGLEARNYQIVYRALHRFQGGFSSFSNTEAIMNNPIIAVIKDSISDIGDLALAMDPNTRKPLSFKTMPELDAKQQRCVTALIKLLDILQEGQVVAPQPNATPTPVAAPITPAFRSRAEQLRLGIETELVPGMQPIGNGRFSVVRQDERAEPRYVSNWVSTLYKRLTF